MPPASVWRLRTRTLTLGDQPLIMGILNVTPDSFSDGGKFLDPEQAVRHGLELVEQGADIIDVGGESTRPYSESVAARDEWDRVGPVVEALVERASIPISIDTSKPDVARQAIEAGAEIINDVTGLTNPAMVELSVATGVGVCAMHMQGTPENMQDDPRYEDVVEEIFAYLGHRRDALEAAGVTSDRICLDPGIGFGKSVEHNLVLLASAGRFLDLGQPLLVGHSRKGFLAKVIGGKLSDPLAATLAVSLDLARRGVQILRVHDVLPTLHALQLLQAVRSCQEAR